MEMNREIKKDIQRVKKRFTKELVLVVPNLDKNMRIKVDILDYATKEVLLIKCKNG